MVLVRWRARTSQGGGEIRVCEQLASPRIARTLAGSCRNRLVETPLPGTRHCLRHPLRRAWVRSRLKRGYTWVRSRVKRRSAVTTTLAAEAIASVVVCAAKATASVVACTMSVVACTMSVVTCAEQHRATALHASVVCAATFFALEAACRTANFPLCTDSEAKRNWFIVPCFASWRPDPRPSVFLVSSSLLK
eukprot:7375908-Prymnesium_polylepis.1